MPILFLLLGGAVLVALAFVFNGPAEASSSPPSDQPPQEPPKDFSFDEPTAADPAPSPDPVPTQSTGWLSEIFSWGNNANPDPSPQVTKPSNDLTGSALPDWQRAIIIDTSARFGIDPRFLAALRKAENGRPGRDFGVLSVATYQPASSSLPELEHAFQDQANVAARTIANNLTRFRAKGREPLGPDGRVTAEFISYFSAIYAPIGATNDPTQLNQNHVANLRTYYANIDYA
jgi:hypothetical protein